MVEQPTGKPFPKPAFWHKKKVLVTGHTGFKGAWLSFWLTHLGAEVHGIALAPDTNPNLFEALKLQEMMSSTLLDICDREALVHEVANIDPDIVIHLAAQPLVRRSYADPLGTFATNVMGTAHLLEALRACDRVKAALMITTDKVYVNREIHHSYREDDRLGGYDPYSASKAACEIVIDSYRQSFLATLGIAVASARAGNVIGGGDWAIDRIVPDAVRAWLAKEPLVVRRPDSVRPWQHVLEALCGYLILVENLWEKPVLAGPYNFGPSADGAVSVRNVVEVAQRAMGSGQVQWGATGVQPHEAGLLMLDTKKVATALSYDSVWSVGEAVSRSIIWYRRFAEGVPARQLCQEDIDRLREARA